MYVVQEVLTAEIAEQTCGKVDAQGRWITAGVSVDVAMACAQQSLLPVAVGYRIKPVVALPGLTHLAGKGGGNAKASAGARKAKKKSKQDKKAAAAAAAQTATTTDEAPVVLTTEQRLAQATAKRRAALKAAESRLSAGGLSPEDEARTRAELGSILIEEAAAIAGESATAFEAKLETCERTPGCDPKNVPPPSADGRAEFQRATDLLGAAIEAQPTAAWVDQARFDHAKALHELGMPKRARTQLEALVKGQPDSALAPAAWHRIGQYYWEVDNFYKALMAFQKVTGFPDHELYSYGLYDTAWCFFYVGEYSKAIDGLQAVVAYEKGSPHPDAVPLTERALADMVGIYADSGRADDALAYFKGLGRADLAKAALQRLARLYVELDRNDKAIGIYTRLIAEFGDSRERTIWQAEVDALK